MNLDSLRRRHFAKKATADSALPATPRTVREPSATERAQVYRAPGEGLLFCFHRKSYFEVCKQCKRDTRIARLQYERFCRNNGLTL